MAIDPKQIFGGIRTAKTGNNNNYERVGHSIQRIDRIRLNEKQRSNEVFLAIDKTVLYVYPDTTEKWIAEGRPPKQAPHSEGEAIVHLMPRRHDNFLGNVKAMIVAIMGCNPDEVTEDDCAEICRDDGTSAAQPLAGRIVEVRAHMIVTSQMKDFTKINYLRTVPATEFRDTVTSAGKANLIERFFPQGALQRMIEIEAAK